MSKEFIVISSLLLSISLYFLFNVTLVRLIPYERVEIDVPSTSTISSRIFSFNCICEESQIYDVSCDLINMMSEDTVCRKPKYCCSELCDKITNNCTCLKSVENQKCYIIYDIKIDNVMYISYKDALIIYNGTESVVTMFYDSNRKMLLESIDDPMEMYVIMVGIFVYLIGICILNILLSKQLVSDKSENFKLYGGIVYAKAYSTAIAFSGIPIILFTISLCAAASDILRLVTCIIGVITTLPIVILFTCPCILPYSNYFKSE